MPDFGEDHKFQAVVGLRTRDSRNKNVALSASNMPSISLTDPSNGGVVANSDIFGSSSSQSRELSLVSSVQYSAFDRYILNFSCNYEGSSKFGSDNRFGFFPAVSARWRLSSEPFLKDFMEKYQVSEFSARASWGQSGNSSSIRDIYAAQATYNTYAPILMLTVDTDPKLSKTEREAILQRLGVGEWQIFGAHGMKKDYSVKA